jgi:NAD(P)-dependent dehydrogenase (short-subunit alcohol dehydrogenase family)
MLIRPMKGHMMEWRKQVAVVTGGARGLGRATARLLAQRGAAVCVNYAVHADAAEAVVAEIATADGRAIAVAADVAEPAAVEAMVTRTEAELGPLTILVNNAGVAWRGTLDTYDRKQVARMRRVNQFVNNTGLSDGARQWLHLNIGRPGCRTEFSNPSTTSSITAATPGTGSSIGHRKHVHRAPRILEGGPGGGRKNSGPSVPMPAGRPNFAINPKLQGKL